MCHHVDVGMQHCENIYDQVQMAVLLLDELTIHVAFLLESSL